MLPPLKKNIIASFFDDENAQLCITGIEGTIWVDEALQSCSDGQRELGLK